MNSDNYEFSKSSSPQDVSDYSAYTDKQWNFVNDINSGVYNVAGQSLVQFDLSNVYSSGMTDITDLYLTIPLVMVGTTSNGTTLTTAPTAGYSLCALKSNYQNIIHQIEVVANGKVINDMQPFIGMYKNFKLLSELSSTDQQSTINTLGLSTSLDNEKSVKFTTANLLNTGSSVSGTASAAPYQGIGLCNNLPFSVSGSAPAGIAIPQNANQSNKAIYDRVSKIIDLTANANYQNIYGAGIAGTTTVAPQPAIMSLSNITNEFKSYYTVSSNVMTWYDTAIIPLKYLCDCIDKMGLVKKMDIVMRFYVNSGAIQIAVQNPNTANLAYGTFTSSFSTTCPLTINWLGASSANGGIAASTTLITAGLYVAKPPSSFGTTSIALGSLTSHPMTACRCYYSQIQLEPEKAYKYLTENTNKQIVYENFLFNQYTSISVGSSFSQLVQSGIKNPVGICIIPLISSSSTFSACDGSKSAGAFTSTAIGFSQFASPYDPCPASYSPLSLTNLQITLGGVNVLNTSLYFSFETFLEQIQLAETLTSADIGVSTGLISQNWWEMNRVYWVDLGRGTEAEKATTRNLNISFINNNQVPIDCMVFTVYLDKFILNCETGQVKK
jgi:hypothetical protein